MKPAFWVLLFCLLVGVYMVARIAVKMLFALLPLCAVILVGLLALNVLCKERRR